MNFTEIIILTLYNTMANTYSFSIKVYDTQAKKLVEALKIEAKKEGVSFSNKMKQVIKKYYELQK